MTREDTLDRGREAFERQAWADAYALLSGADREARLGLDDVEKLATAAYLTGAEAACSEQLARAHRLALEAREPARAARAAFWLAFWLLYRGDLAQGGGWLGRAGRVLEEAAIDCVEEGYLLVPAGIGAFEERDMAAAEAAFTQALETGRRFGDPDLLALAALGQGSTLIWLGRPAEGVALLDEAMVSVVAGEVSPVAAGVVYCGVIEACWDLFDVRRAGEWTAALSRWCDSMPELLPYRGPCLVHRSEILQLRGQWRAAQDEARRACQLLDGLPGLGAAYYQEAEVHRLQGRFAEAEAAYRRASDQGRSPQPGLARLRLAQGRVDAAVVAIHRVVEEATDRVTRARILGAFVDICLAGGDTAGARKGADELLRIAAETGMPYLDAVAAYADGAVLLGEGSARAACAALNRSLERWRALDAPYEVARARLLLGLACRDLGDEDTGDLEQDAARQLFRQLGAGPDLDHAERLWGGGRSAGGLTAREVEVLALVATGRTNKAIAADLVISEKTVARHLSNIFTKLGVGSRAAATAYAFQHDLV